MAEGWIKLHRRITESGFWTDSYAVHLWIHLLITATYSPKKTLFNGKIVELQQGQLITGRKKLSAETGISEQIIRKWLELFEINQQITIEKTSAGSCISILNYKNYQQDNQQTSSSSTNDQPAINQQSTSDQPLLKEKKKIKKEKNIKKKEDMIPPTIEEVENYFVQNGFSKELAKRAYKYYADSDWHDKNGNKVINWKQKMQTVWMTVENKQTLKPTANKIMQNGNFGKL